jgi:hypothetical protein
MAGYEGMDGGGVSVERENRVDDVLFFFLVRERRWLCPPCVATQLVLVTTIG